MGLTGSKEFQTPSSIPPIQIFPTCPYISLFILYTVILYTWPGRHNFCQNYIVWGMLYRKQSTLTFSFSYRNVPSKCVGAKSSSCASFVCFICNLSLLPHICLDALRLHFKDRCKITPTFIFLDNPTSYFCNLSHSCITGTLYLNR